MNNHLLKLRFFLLTIFITTSSSAQYQLTKLWQTDSVFNMPESVLYNKKGDFLFVANIAGTGPWDKDGNGYISKLGIDGKIITKQWVTGLNAPKGMGIYKDKLYVADVTEVVEIDINNASITKRIPIDSAQRLNDITIDKKGVIYVSDIRGKKIYSIKNGKSAIELENLTIPNGLTIYKKHLYLLDNGALFKREYNNTLTKMSDGMKGIADGLEFVGNKSFIATVWEGEIWLINKNGEKQLLIDSKEKKISTADIGYNSATKTVFVPTFFSNTVIAFHLEIKK